MLLFIKDQEYRTKSRFKKNLINSVLAYVLAWLLCHDWDGNLVRVVIWQSSQEIGAKGNRRWQGKKTGKSVASAWTRGKVRVLRPRPPRLGVRRRVSCSLCGSAADLLGVRVEEKTGPWWGATHSAKGNFPLETERLHFHFSLSWSGERNGNPLQCSCLESPGDGGAWWAAVYGVTQSRTRLEWLSSSSSYYLSYFYRIIKAQVRYGWNGAVFLTLLLCSTSEKLSLLN